jgi:hypothetical protein
MLDTFGMQQGGSQYRRLIAAFQHVFGANIFFGTDTHRSISSVVHEARFNFMSEARIWYSRDPGQSNLPGECQNLIVLNEEFYREILEHPIPTDLEAAKALSSSPALDAFTWISYRCFVAKGKSASRCLGNSGWPTNSAKSITAGRGGFGNGWRMAPASTGNWPECPARTSEDGYYLVVNRATALVLRGGAHACA